MVLLILPQTPTKFQASKLLEICLRILNLIHLHIHCQRLLNSWTQLYQLSTWGPELEGPKTSSAPHCTHTSSLAAPALQVTPPTIYQCTYHLRQFDTEDNENLCFLHMPEKIRRNL